MRRPVQAILVVVEGHAAELFEDRDEAHAYMNGLDQPAQAQVVPYWPAGTWLFGTARNRRHDGDHELVAAFLKHLGVSRRCQGTNVETDQTTAGVRHRCGHCGDRL